MINYNMIYFGVRRLKFKVICDIQFFFFDFTMSLLRLDRILHKVVNMVNGDRFWGHEVMKKAGAQLL
jgi:hypothetical protein